MHISTTESSPTEAKLEIKAEAHELQKAKEHALNHMAPNVKVPGFRPGQVPQNIVERHVDGNLLQTEVLEEAINKLYASAIRQENLRPVANPQISIKKFVPFTELEFEATVAVVSGIKIADYRKIKLTRPIAKIEAKDIEEVLKSLQTRAAERSEVKREARDNDEVVIDFKGTDSKSQPVNGADGKDYPLVLGSNSFIPGFEENLIGLKVGENKSFMITFPKNYGVKALQGQKVTFEVTVKKVSEIVKPKLDDAFAANTSPFKTLKELKNDIKKQLTLEREREVEQQFENELLNKIAEKSAMNIPKLLVDEQIDRIETEEKQNLAYRGQTWEEHLKEEGVNAEEHREQKRSSAEQRLKISILLSEIAAVEKLDVTPEELEVRLQIMKGQYRDAAAQTELDKPEARRDIANRLLTEKTLEKLKSYAGAK